MKTTLDTIKEEISDKVIFRLASIRHMNDAQKKQYIESLKGALKQRNLITKIREQSGRTNAEDYNETAFEMYLDMLTTFSYIDELYDTINTHQKLNRSIINTIYSTIAGLNDRIDEIEAYIRSNSSAECHIEYFRTQNNQEWDPLYYTERYGEKVPLEIYARFNSEQENISLNYTRQQNVMTYRSGVQLGEISISKQYGAGFISARNSQTRLENAIDNSPASYWADTILADAELKIVGEGFESQDYIGKTTRSYYNLPQGALCEICLTFEALAKINEIILNPFGSFPIDIVAIRYSLTDDDQDDIYDIVSPDNNNWLSSRSLDKEYAFHFKQITCKRLFILINQLHFIKDTYLISSNQMFKNELWFNATYNDSKILHNESYVFKPLYLDRAVESNIWKYVNNKLVSNKSIDINQILVSNKNKMLPMTKYQYTYGFYNIAPNFVEFQLASIWVSKEIASNRPISSVRIKSFEEHFTDSFGLISTDIEFYITTKKTPLYSDWKPICPVNKSYINRELLQLDYEYCYLRHNAVCGTNTTMLEDGTFSTESERPIVYYNNVKLTEDVDYILRFNEDGSVYAIEISNIDHFAIYTVSYMPVESSKEIVFNDFNNADINSTFDEIAGNGTACYRLTDVPYYDMSNNSKTESYLRIIDTVSGRITSQKKTEDSIIECVTNKSSPAESYKNFVANTNKIQYYTYGRNLYFNQPIPVGNKIEINYPSVDSSVRVKVILRRNTKLDLWVTPILNGYVLELTTLGGMYQSQIDYNDYIEDYVEPEPTKLNFNIYETVDDPEPISTNKVKLNFNIYETTSDPDIPDTPTTVPLRVHVYETTEGDDEVSLDIHTYELIGDTVSVDIHTYEVV